MQKKASPMSPSAARAAAMPARLQEAVTKAELPARCLKLFALSAEQPARFPSSPEKIALFTAAIASPREDNFAQIKERFERNALFLLPLLHLLKVVCPYCFFGEKMIDFI